MKSRIKYLIWDWNGTLFNDVNLDLNIINNLLKNYDLELLTYEKYRNIFTFPVYEYYQKAGFDFNKTSFEILGRMFMEQYEKRKFEIDLFEEAREILQYAKDKGIKQSVLSAYKHDTLLEVLQHYKYPAVFRECFRT
ncbi:MAG: HAD family hydrolase [Ignavibacterium sp.]|uniref:HAD family hydrolase n=1 Tax=Ignavibacterium sp. TaxID=2651167 RepID=UPI00404A4FDD